MMDTPALWVAFAAMVPLMTLVARWDLKYLKIPNWQVLCVLAVFVVTGLWGLPLGTFGWHLLWGAIALFIGFGFFSLGVLGGGDAKMLAALVPFISGQSVLAVLLIFALSCLMLLVGIWIAWRIAGSRETGWLAIDQMDKPARYRAFPMGLIFAISITLYLGLHVVGYLP